MTDKHNNNHKTKVDPVKAGIAGAVTGAVVGAGVAVAAAVAMKDDKTKAKMQDVLHTVGNKASEYLDGMKSEAATQLSQKIEETTQDIEKNVSHTKKHTK